MLNDQEKPTHKITAETHPIVWGLLQATTKEITNDDPLDQMLCDCCTTELGSDFLPDLNWNLDATFYDEKDLAIDDLRTELKYLETSAAKQLSDYSHRISASENSISALTYNLDSLKDKLEDLGEKVAAFDCILKSGDREVILLLTRCRFGELLKFMGVTAIGFALILAIGSVTSGSQSQKDYYSELTVLTGLGAVAGVAIGYAISED